MKKFIAVLIVLMLSLSYSCKASEIYHIECYAESTKIINVYVTDYSTVNNSVIFRDIITDKKTRVYNSVCIISESDIETAKTVYKDLTLN